MSDLVIVYHISNVLEVKPKLCKNCRILVYGIFQARYVFHHLSWDILGLQNSQKDGCSICHMFVASLGSEAVKSISPSQIGTVQVSGNLSQIYFDGTVSIDFRTNATLQETADQHRIRTCIDATLVDKDAWVNAKASELAPETDDTMTWDCVNRWLQECAFPANDPYAHYHCRRPVAPSSELPKRLIYIPSGDESFTNLRLRYSEHVLEQSLARPAHGPGFKEAQSEQAFQNSVNSSETSPHTRSRGIQYVALSHCWGSKMPITTTRDNLDEMGRSIPFPLLSKTFQHAILATYRLGLQYLWIDSLCIIQGDYQDWAQEASRMGSIYANSFLNIVAADADDGSVGCFFHRDLSSLYGCTIYFKKPEHNVDFSKALCLTPSRLFRSMKNCCTSTRGWCFQETFLAPRSLYFCKTQLFWMCRVKQACETLPDWKYWPIMARHVDRHTALAGVDPRCGDLDQWISLLSPYTQGKLTHAKDRLTAFSGVARIFDNWGDLYTKYTNPKLLPRADAAVPYFAGVWTGRFQKPHNGYGAQLLWYVPADERRIQNPELKAPSWSVDGPIVTSLIVKSLSSTHAYSNRRLILHGTTFELAIRDVSVKLRTPDPFGEVLGGSIELECRVAGPFELEDDRLRLRGGSGSAMRGHNKRAAEDFDQYEVFPDVISADKVEIYCAHAWRVFDLSYPDKLPLPDGELEAAGLLLEKLTTGKFRRVGVYLSKKGRGDKINLPQDTTIMTVL